MKRGIFFIGLSLLLTSCVGYYSKEIFTPLKSDYKADCVTPPTEVQLLFEGESVNFEYERIGLIEVQAEYTGKEADQLKVLTNLAKAKCCDAVIGIKKGYVVREIGLVFTNETNQTYQAVSFSGIAVKKKN
jgi:hypothetical protein